jgi:hypothetical protein
MAHTGDFEVCPIGTGERLKALEAFEKAMSPRENPRHPTFRDHNCWKCRDGELPCPHEYSLARCEYPHARND